MYAIIFTGGKQYRVEVGTEVKVEKLDNKIGDTIQLQCLGVFGGNDVNTKKATVTAQVLEHGKGEKINIFKYKAKKNVRKRMGHRQPFTKIKITAI